MTQIDAQTYVYAVVAAMKPAAAKVLFAMLFCPQLHGVNELAMWTTMDRGTVRSALVNLEQLGFVCNNGRYEAWILTARARQMVLGEGENFPLPLDCDGADGQCVEVSEAQTGADGAGEGENFPLASSSSSLISDVSVSEVSETTTTPTGDPDPPCEEALRWLMEAGVPRKRAVAAVRQALARGWDGAQISRCVGGWLDYAETPEGASIRSPGFVALARLRECAQAPPIPAREMTTSDYIAAEMARRREAG